MWLFGMGSPLLCLLRTERALHAAARPRSGRRPAAGVKTRRGGECEGKAASTSNMSELPIVRESTEPGAISVEPPSGRETDPDDDAALDAPPIHAAMPVVRESTEPGAISVQPPSGRETDPDDDDAALGPPPIHSMPIVRESSVPGAISVEAGPPTDATPRRRPRGRTRPRRCSRRRRTFCRCSARAGRACSRRKRCPRHRRYCDRVRDYRMRRRTPRRSSLRACSTCDHEKS